MVRCPPSPPPKQIKAFSLSGQDSHQEGADEQQRLLSHLHALHADEFVNLSRKLTGSERKYGKSWVHSSYAMIKTYFWFLLNTWTKVAWGVIFFPACLMDCVSAITLSALTCIIMSVLLFWCLLCNIPFVVESFDYISKHACNGLSIVNASYPTIFEELSREEIAAGRKHLSQPIKESRNRLNRRIFNLDASKLLLQCAALMYERDSRATHRAAAVAASNSHLGQTADPDLLETAPGSRLEEKCGTAGAQAVTAELHSTSCKENTIVDIAYDKLGLNYTTISELNSIGSAFCGLFWDPQDTFIIVSFKGTTPTDFSEWTSDFTIHMREAGLWLRGFGKAHDGFMNKVFPTRIPPDSCMPYTTIIEAIKSVSAHLSSSGKPINVWITGHSLGCALASLFYARLINEPHECGASVVVRDVYLFAAPVVCDVLSANAFNGRMNHFSEFPRTMWRVTNGGDAVATCLPDGGDNVGWLFSPWNLFSFSHLGCEVKLQSAPKRCKLSGMHITPGTWVAVESEFHPGSLDSKKTPLRRVMHDLQEIPLLGRILAHGTGFYWAALQDVGMGKCEWVTDDE
ncbi:hypothetical protein M0805_007653 [Coniferiporia weirii]|nr:hypothetical protein M0805_007653 [Coniferiporia weirii]